MNEFEGAYSTIKEQVELIEMKWSAKEQKRSAKDCIIVKRSIKEHKGAQGRMNEFEGAYSTVKEHVGLLDSKVERKGA